MAITAGAPNKEVIALIGKVLLLPGICETRSHAVITMAPSSMHPGINTRWFAVLNTILAKWGIAIPINAKGPQNAVMPPARIEVIIITTRRVRLIFTPKLLA
jgi:hypothetical protein